VYTFGSINLLSDLTGSVTLLLGGLFACAYLFTLLRFWQQKFDFARTCLLLVLIFIATGKVFSPQYIIWILPLLAYAGIFNCLTLIVWGATTALTTYIYPVLYLRADSPTHTIYVPHFIQTLFIRNSLLVIATLALLFDWFRDVGIRKTTPLDHLD
jgi:hypothetical protein